MLLLVIERKGSDKLKKEALIIAKNVRAYLIAIDKSEDWVCERSGIAKADLDNLLKSEGNATRDLPKLNKLFRIQDPNYFYNEQIQLPRTLNELDVDSIRNFSLRGDNSDSEAFKETMCILDDLMNMIHTLKTAKEIG